MGIYSYGENETEAVVVFRCRPSVFEYEGVTYVFKFTEKRNLDIMCEECAILWTTSFVNC